REQVLMNPQEEYTQRLLAAAPVPDPLEQKKRCEERHELRRELGDEIAELDVDAEEVHDVSVADEDEAEKQLGRAGRGPRPARWPGGRRWAECVCSAPARRRPPSRACGPCCGPGTRWSPS